MTELVILCVGVLIGRFLPLKKRRHVGVSSVRVSHVPIQPDYTGTDEWQLAQDYQTVIGARRQIDDITVTLDTDVTDGLVRLPHERGDFDV